MINWHLDGYGMYVWPAYIATFFVVIALAAKSYLTFRKTLKAQQASHEQSHVE